jgi:replicative superfamily II helicase
LRIVETTGETDDLSPIPRGQYDIGLFTYEKFAAIALSQPHVVEQAGVIVVDEAGRRRGVQGRWHPGHRGHNDTCDGDQHPGLVGRDRGPDDPGGKPNSVAECKNLVGRAGRPGKSERGASYVVAMTALEADQFWRRDVKSKPEDLASRFFDDGTDLRSLIVRTVVAGGRAGLTEDEIADFLEGRSV